MGGSVAQNQNLKILIVEDEVPLLKALSSKFTREGFLALEATDGREALEMALKEHPNVIISDIFMPDMDGMEFVKQLRNDDWGKTAKMMFLTNLNNSEDVAKAMEYGVTDYLVKSDMRLEDIMNKVKEMIER